MNRSNPRYQSQTERSYSNQSRRKMLRRNMKKELVSEDDLMSWLREKGVEKVSDVKKACMEGNGKISIVKKTNRLSEILPGTIVP